jgi:hypothetical protein
MISRRTFFFNGCLHLRFTTNFPCSNPHIQPLYSSCLSFFMPSLSRLSLNSASPFIAQLSRLWRLSTCMPSPRVSLFRSEAPSLIGYKFNAPEVGLTKPKKPPTVNHSPIQPNAHTVPPSTYVPKPILILRETTGFGLSKSLKVAIIMIDNQVTPLPSTKQGRSIGLDPKSLLESVKAPHQLQYRKEFRPNVRQQAKNLPLIPIGLSVLCSNIANQIWEVTRAVEPGYPQIQNLLKQDNDEWIIHYDVDGDQQSIAASLVHRSSIKFQKLPWNNPLFLWMDCSYKTNRYHFLLLDKIGESAVGKIVYIGLAFITNEREPAYRQVLRWLKGLLG